MIPLREPRIGPGVAWFRGMALLALTWGLAAGYPCRADGSRTNPVVFMTVATNYYAPFSTRLTPGAWVYVDADPAANSPVRATQRALGYREVDYKAALYPTLDFRPATPATNGPVITYDDSGQAGSTNTVGYWAAKDAPIIVGPDGQAYISDAHHTSASYLAPASPVREFIPGLRRVILGHIVANYYDPAGGPQPVTDAWWLARAAENNAFLYGVNGNQLALPDEPDYPNLQPILPSLLPMPTTPSTLTLNGVTAMLPSPYRSLAWGLADGVVFSATDDAGKKIVGFKKKAPDSSVEINFVEFFWADFLRHRIIWDDTRTGSPYGANNGDANLISAPLGFFAAVANGIALARSEAYRDQYGRALTDYTNAALFSANTVNWARGSVSNGWAKPTDTYHLFLLDDSGVAGDLAPSAYSTNILHINTAAGLTVTNHLLNLRQLLVNDGPQIQTAWKDAAMSNSTLLVPAGSGTVALEGAAVVAAGAIVSRGALRVNGTLRGAVTVAGGALGGTGAIIGPVTVLAAGALAPDGPLGALTVNGPLNLGGSTELAIAKHDGQIQRAPLTGASRVSYGGTLSVSVSGDALQAGDVIKLFDAASYRGAFTGYRLPALRAGLAWDTSGLLVDGSIAVGLPDATPPALALAPLTLTANAAGAVRFVAGAVGSEPLTYEWFRDGALLSASSADAALALPMVQETDRGHYWLVVRNAAGAVTSAPVVLTVMPHYGTERFDAVVNHGAGKMPGMKHNFGMHSDHLTPLFAKGQGAELFSQWATNTDTVRGPYVENIDVNRIVKTAFTNGVKNIILMISDGAGFSTYEATSYYQYGELGRQVYDGWPVRIACATSPLNSMSAPTTNTAPASTRGWYDESIWRSFYKGTSNWTDSSAAGSALSCGQKTYNFSIGWSDDNYPMTNISQTAKWVFGKKVGIVTTVPISHATPATFTAHNPSRMAFEAIATEQLTGPLVDVLMGAGHPLYSDNNLLTNVPDYSYVGGLDLWTSLVDGRLGWKLLQTRGEFEALADGSMPVEGRLCGIAQARMTLQQARNGTVGSGLEPAFVAPFNPGVPNLATMARGALRSLAKDNTNGFFILIEGGAVDLANHAWQQGRMIEEQIDFNTTVEAVDHWVTTNGGWENNLVIVTADHETGLLFGPDAGGVPALAATSLSPANTVGLLTEHGTVRLSWNAVTGATGYRLQVTRPDLTTAAYVSAANRLSLTNVDAGAYAWTVTAVNDFGEGPASPPAAFSVLVRDLVLTTATNVLSAPATFSLAANVAEQDGLVTRVTFYENGQAIGEAAKYPFQITLAGWPLGDHSFLAAALDSRGQTTVSGAINVTVLKAPGSAPLTLQILHVGDLEAGVTTVADAPAFSSVLGALQAQYPTNTLRLLSGNNFIPGPFFNAGADPAAGFNGVGGRAEISLLNALGFQASVLGNHEFDVNTAHLRSLIEGDPAVGYPGTLFPYLSANLDFGTDDQMAALATTEGQRANTLSNRVAKSCVIPVAGQLVGVVGATTPDLRAISFAGTLEVDTNVTASVQAAVDGLLAQGVNKVIVLAQFPQYDQEIELARRLRDVDVVIAGGSQAIFANPADHLRDGDVAVTNYPVWLESALGEPVAVVNAGFNYEYVGRLILDFDTNGLIRALDPASGVYATDAQGVANTGRYPTNATVASIVTTVGSIINVKDGNLFGRATVYLNSLRQIQRAEEVNLGDLVCDANLWYARNLDPATSISLKSGGGIRDSIGAVLGTGADAVRVPPLANPSVGKQSGQISQLDIENALRYNNGLSLLTLTAQQLRDTLEWAVAGVVPGALPGQFPQVGGLWFSFVPTNPPMTYTRSNTVITGVAAPGSRLQSLVARRADGRLDLVVERGSLVGDPNRTYRLVTLDFLADGGDDYYPLTLAAQRLDLVASTNRVFATAGAEQWALAAYLANIQVYTQADTAADQDQRIQNTALRPDTITWPRLTDLILGAGPKVSFTTLPGKYYQVWAATGIEGPWRNLTATPIPGDGGPASFTDPVPAPSRTFYRITRID